MTKELNSVDESTESDEPKPTLNKPDSLHDSPAESLDIPTERPDAQLETIKGGAGDDVAHDDADESQHERPDNEPLIPKASTGLWVNPENAPDDPYPLEKKTWWETYHELNDILQPRRGRTYGEFFEQVLDTALNQLHKSLKDYVAPHPKIDVPGWWTALRDPTAKLVEGLHKRPWYESIVIGGFFAGSITAPLPGPNVLAPILAVPGALIALGVRLSGVRIESIDTFMVKVAHPVAKAVYAGTNWVLKTFGFERAGKRIDGFVNSILEARKEKKEKQLKEWEKAGDSGEIAATTAEWMLFGMTHGQNLDKVVDMVERSSPHTYTKDLLENFNRPVSLVNLEELKTAIKAGERYQKFEETMKNAGFECDVVSVGETLIIKIWKTGTSPQANEQDESYIPEPRAPRTGQ